MRDRLLFAIVVLGLLVNWLYLQAAAEDMIKLRPLSEPVVTGSDAATYTTPATTATAVPAASYQPAPLQALTEPYPVAKPAETAMAPSMRPQSAAYTLTPISTPAQPRQMNAGALTTGISKGTLMLVQLDHPINSSSAKVGDEVIATLENDLFTEEAVIIPAGSELVGTVIGVTPSRRMGRHGELEIRFNTLKSIQYGTVPIRAHVVTKDDSGILKGNSYAHDVLVATGITAGGTALGAGAGLATGVLLGAAGPGVAIGAAVGGLAGATYAVLRTGKEVMLPEGTHLSVQVDKGLALN